MTKSTTTRHYGMARVLALIGSIVALIGWILQLIGGITNIPGDVYANHWNYNFNLDIDIFRICED